MVVVLVAVAAAAVVVTSGLHSSRSYFVLFFTPFFTMVDAKKGLKNR